ncbi:hypothetical protein EB796_017695 [Bugula neritina]|uniref:Uncharacterized protein n=1 Tax=Bugula neritina TaxID=10212 RepID=A0A7J7JF47_BUGNE|nr:hypothetical protein EB796_017695 [Bugula neritina]
MMMSSTPAWVKQEFQEAGASNLPVPSLPDIPGLKLNLGSLKETTSPTGEFLPNSENADSASASFTKPTLTLSA